MQRINKEVTYQLYRGDRPFNLSTSTDNTTVGELGLARQMFRTIFQSDSLAIESLNHFAMSGAFVLGAGEGVKGKYMRLRIEQISPQAIIAIAEICAVLRCRLVTSDGGPDVDPTAEALLLDICRRSMAWIRPAGKSLHDIMLDDLVFG